MIVDPFINVFICVSMIYLIDEIDIDDTYIGWRMARVGVKGAVESVGYYKRGLKGTGQGVVWGGWN